MLSPQSSSLPNWSENAVSEVAQNSSHFPQGWVGKHSGRGDRETGRTRRGEEYHENLSSGHGKAAAARNSRRDSYLQDLLNYHINIPLWMGSGISRPHPGTRAWKQLKVAEEEDTRHQGVVCIK